MMPCCCRRFSLSFSSAAIDTPLLFFADSFAAIDYFARHATMFAAAATPITRQRCCRFFTYYAVLFYSLMPLIFSMLTPPYAYDAALSLVATLRCSPL